MSASNHVEQERTRLGFADAVRKHFDFLCGMGFREFESQPTLVRYGRKDLEVAIYHGRQSYEIGFEILRSGIRYSIEQLIRLAAPEVAKQYRSFQTTTPQGVEEGVTRLEGLVRQYGERALSGDPVVFAALDQQRKSWAEEYALDVLARQLRAKADAAFRSGDYRTAVDLYEQIRERLSAAELKKMELSRERSGP